MILTGLNNNSNFFIYPTYLSQAKVLSTSSLCLGRAAAAAS